MKKYETPEITVTELVLTDVIAARFTESSDDNTTDWVDAWTSAILGKQ